MILTTHQPIFLPWSGFFFKAFRADCMVLLDCVQHPLGRSWMSRNRLKCAAGELWITVPVLTKGRGLQSIKNVEILYPRNWAAKQLRSIRESYVNAPYFDDYFHYISDIFSRGQDRLCAMNLDFIRFFWDVLKMRCQLLVQSDLGVIGRGTELLFSLCSHLGASEYLAFRPAAKYIDAALMEKKGVSVRFASFQPPVYPQLWGDFLYNLSTLDLFLNCGPKSSRIIQGV